MPRAYSDFSTAVNQFDFPAASAAYEKIRTRDGFDLDRAKQLAQLRLNELATKDSGQIARMALSHLLLNRESETTLKHISETAADTVVHVRALRALTTRYGDAQAEAELYGLLYNTERNAVDDPLMEHILVSARLASDGELLRLALRDPRPRVRAIAARKLVREERAEVRKLAESDLDDSVRLTALRALKKVDEKWLIARLRDKSERIRAVAAEMLVRKHEGRSSAAIDALLAVQPSYASASAAAKLLDGPSAKAAANHLKKLFQRSPAQLQIHTALRLSNAESRCDYLPAILPPNTKNRSLAMQIARSWRDCDDDKMSSSLSALMDRVDMVAVQSAGLLADEDAETSMRFLLGLLQQTQYSATLRAAAARNLGADLGVGEVLLPFLNDEEDMVQVFAAGGILGIEHSQ